MNWLTDNPLVAPLRAWGWRHSAWAVFAGAANVFCNGTPLANSGQPYDPWNALAYNVLQFGFPLVYLLGVADRLSDRGRLPPVLAYLGAVLLTVVLGVWFIAPALEPWLGRVPWWNDAADQSLAASSFGWLLLGAGVYAQRRISLRERARLDAAEAARTARERELAAARLLTLQARVEPELLFERLRAIDAELLAAPDTARQRLSVLIDLLRLLQPHHEARVSSLAREFEGAALLARLLGRDARQPERLHLQLPPALAERPMAPSVLLPLLRVLLAEPGTLWSVQAQHLPARPGGTPQLQLQVHALGPDTLHTERAAARLPLDQLRERLQAVHGPSAQLRQAADTPLPQIELAWPAS